MTRPTLVPTAAGFGPLVAAVLAPVVIEITLVDDANLFLPLRPADNFTTVVRVFVEPGHGLIRERLLLLGSRFCRPSTRPSVLRSREHVFQTEKRVTMHCRFSVLIVGAVWLSGAGSTFGQSDVSSLGDEGVAWYTRWDTALAEAKRSRRPILFMAAAASCSGVPGVF